MSASIMSGFISEEQDAEFVRTFSESMTASEFLKHVRGRPVRLFFPDDELGEGMWCEVREVDGRLYIEIGEGAA